MGQITRFTNLSYFLVANFPLHCTWNSGWFPLDSLKIFTNLSNLLDSLCSYFMEAICTQSWQYNNTHTILNISTASIILMWPPFTKQTAASNSITVMTVLKIFIIVTFNLPYILCLLQQLHGLRDIVLGHAYG